MDTENKYNQKRKSYKNNRNYKENRERKPQSEQSYRFRRVLGEILKYLKTIPHQSSFSECQEEYGAQLTELIQRGYTWGYNYSIPVHAGDFKALQKKEWAAIRAIVKKQEYNGSLTNY